MFGYFVLFVVIGFLVSKLITNEKTIFIVYVVISVGWGVSFGPIWGLVTFGELAAGFGLKKLIN